MIHSCNINSNIWWARKMFITLRNWSMRFEQFMCLYELLWESIWTLDGVCKLEQNVFIFHFISDKKTYLIAKGKKKTGKKCELSIIHENVWQRKRETEIKNKCWTSIKFSLYIWTLNLTHKHNKPNNMYKYQIPEPTFDSNGFAIGDA